MVIIENENIFINKRSAKDIWIGLYDFPLIETKKRVDSFKTINNCFKDTSFILQKKSVEQKHILSHQKIYATFWQATADNLEKLQADGKIKSIGLSNFLPHHIKALLKTAKVKPTVNQLEFHPGFMQNECVQFCKENDIQVQGWSPLGRGGVLDNETLMALSEKYRKSVAQLCIRWALQNQVAPLPRSVTASRIKENFEVFDFEISSEDMDIINAMNFGGSGFNPDTVTF